jgi:uncharacterized protein YqgC (DUF456 family)
MGDILLLSAGIVMMIIGLLGCILPVLPGPPLSFVGLLALHFSKYAQFSFNFLVLFGSITVIVTVLDYIVPLWGTKKFGGSKAGIWGATIGLLLGIILFPPLGIIIGPFAGAVIGETLTGKKSSEAFRAGLGSLMGFLMGVGLKLVTSIVMTYHFIKELII